MKLTVLVVLSCVVFGGARTQDGENPANGRLVPARTIPTPATVSPELQSVIARPILVREKAAKIEPLNVEEWRLLIIATNEAVVATMLKMRMTFPVKIERQTIAGVKAHVITPTSIPEANRNRVLVHLHGGAYVFYGGEFGLGEAILIAHHAKMKVISVDYRMPPDHPFPAALDDAVAVWKEVTTTSPPANTGLFGSSAGGGLTMATVLKLKELQVPLPGALFLGTPWADLTKSGDTLFTNAQIDDVLVTHDGILKAAARLYAGSQALEAPLLSPIGGDFAGFPPTILVSGTRDLFLSDTVRVHRKLRAAGVGAELHVFEGLSHAQYLDVYTAPEAKDAFGEVSRFFDLHLGR
jgi:acetyl esterase/lipase